MPKRKKKKEEEYSFLSIAVENYEISCDTSINLSLRQERPMFYNEDDLAYEFITSLDISGTCISPSDRKGDRIELKIRGCERHAGEFSATLKDFQKRGEYGSPVYKEYRGEQYPVHNPPPGIALFDKRRGEPIWDCWLWVAPRLVSDMLILLTQKSGLYISIHEKKIKRQRWVQNFSLRTVDPEME